MRGRRKAALAFKMTAPRTNVYIDGFNLYYGCLKDTPYRWLDLGKMCRLLLPKHAVNKIRYFTARVRPRDSDPQQLQRQLTYLRALRTIPNLSIHEGHFLCHPRMLPLVNPAGSNKFAEVLCTSEKGSDVNLATYLILDALDKDCDVAAVVSNDSDLMLPIRQVQDRFKIPIGFVNPQKSSPKSQQLSSACSFYKEVRAGLLQACQFPPAMTDANGTITKPSVW